MRGCLKKATAILGAARRVSRALRDLERSVRKKNHRGSIARRAAVRLLKDLPALRYCSVPFWQSISVVELVPVEPSADCGVELIWSCCAEIVSVSVRELDTLSPPNKTDVIVAFFSTKRRNS